MTLSPPHTQAEYTQSLLKKTDTFSWASAVLIAQSRKQMRLEFVLTVAEREQQVNMGLKPKSSFWEDMPSSCFLGCGHQAHHRFCKHKRDS